MGCAALSKYKERTLPYRTKASTSLSIKGVEAFFIYSRQDVRCYLSGFLYVSSAKKATTKKVKVAPPIR